MAKQGRIKRIEDASQGTFEAKKIVLEYYRNFDKEKKQPMFSAFTAGKFHFKVIDTLKVGDIVNIEYDISGSKTSDKEYAFLNIEKIEKLGSSSQRAPVKIEEDDLPF